MPTTTATEPQPTTEPVDTPKKLTIISSECTIDDILDIDEAVGGRIFERAKAFSLKPDKRRNYRLRGATEL